MKTIIATIKPVHLGNIRRGLKLCEIRKTAPKEVPFRVMLCESGSGGQIKAEFVCDAVRPVKVCEDGEIQHWYYFGLNTACITHDEMAAYIGHGKTGCAWHITKMVDYCSTKRQKVRHISEFGINKVPQSWVYAKGEKV